MWNPCRLGIPARPVNAGRAVSLGQVFEQGQVIAEFGAEGNIVAVGQDHAFGDQADFLALLRADVVDGGQMEEGAHEVASLIVGDVLPDMLQNEVPVQRQAQVLLEGEVGDGCGLLLVEVQIGREDLLHPGAFFIRDFVIGMGDPAQQEGHDREVSGSVRRQVLQHLFHPLEGGGVFFLSGRAAFPPE